MVNTATLEESLAVSTNLLCTLFVMTYVATRYYMQRRDQHRSRTHRPRPPTFVRTLRLNAPRTFVLLGVAAVAAMLSWQTIDLRAQSEVIEATPQYLLVQKYLCFMPVPMLLMLVNVKGRKMLRHPFWLLVTLFVLACVLISQNPLIEKRNAIVDAVTMDHAKAAAKRLWGQGLLTVVVGRAPQAAAQPAAAPATKSN